MFPFYFPPKRSVVPLPMKYGVLVDVMAACARRMIDLYGGVRRGHVSYGWANVTGIRHTVCAI